jgi:cytochrome P450
MRLYPPAWIVAREAIDDVELGDWTIPRGSQIWMPQWVVHRMERFYDDPETFRPERWLDEEFVEGLPRFAYFPFGGGARICIGNHFAMMEAVLILATMIRRVSFDPIPGQTIEFSPSVTLRPADGVWMRTRLH